MTLSQKIHATRMAFQRWQNLANEVMTEIDALAGKTLCPIEEIATIQATVARYCSIPVHLLSAEVRTDHIAHARQMAMTISRELTRHTNGSIADCFRRTRTALDHAMRAVRNRVQTDAKFAREFAECLELCRVAIRDRKQEVAA